MSAALPIVRPTGAEIDAQRAVRWTMTQAGRDVLKLAHMACNGEIRCAWCGKPIDDNDEFTIVGGPMVPIHAAPHADSSSGCAEEVSNLLWEADGPPRIRHLPTLEQSR